MLSRCIAPSFHHDGKQKKNILFKSWRDQSSGEGEFKTEGDMTQRWKGTEGDEWQKLGTGASKNTCTLDTLATDLLTLEEVDWSAY